MNPNREEALFALALAKPAEKRAAFLNVMCEGDDALRQRLEGLLAAHDATANLLHTAAGQAPTIKLDLAELPDEAVGQTLGRYKLLERVGEGGCGVVYVAEQTEPVRRRVALKVIKLGMDTKQVVARFEAERQALAMMDHPNIAKVLDAGMTLGAPASRRQLREGEEKFEERAGETPALPAGRPYFVMELVRGIKITDYCDQAHLSTKERLDLFIKVCQAIQHAHQKGIIHRDIKPSNILVTLHDGVPVPKVIDFGIAKATEGRLTDNTVYTQLHQFIGTPAYMSPEQAEMSGLDIDTRSDIYSLGVLLYELLAGSTPFDGKELMASGIDQMRKTIREKEPPRPSTRLATLGADQLTTTAKRRSAETSKLLHQLKGDLDWIVMKCLEKDRQRRYDTANGLAADLKRHLNNEPVTARPPSTAYRFQKAWRRNKLAYAAATAVVAALLFGVIVSTWQATVATRAKNQATRAEAGKAEEARKAQDERDNAKAAEAQAQTARKLAESAQQHSRRLLYSADMNLAQQSLKLNNLGRARRLLDRHRPQPGEEDLRGWEWRYLWQLTRSGALVTLTNRPVRGFSVSFSPDGTRLAVGWYDGHVDLWDVPGRRWIRALTSREQPHQGRVAFSPVRNLLAATSETNAVTLYDLDSGRESLLWRAPGQGEWSVRDISFSQDGSRAVIYAGGSARAAGPRQRVGDVVWVVNVSSSKIESRHPTVSSVDPYFGASRLSPDNGRLYLARSDVLNYRASIQCLDLVTGQELWQTERERDRGLTTLAISPDGRVLASGSGYEDPTIRVWEAATGRLLARLVGHTGWVCKLAFTKDGRRLISAASDQSIRFWDPSNWTEARILRGHGDEVHAVAFSETSQLVASASKDGDLVLWKDDGKGAADGYTRLSEDVQAVLPLDRSRLLLLSSDKPPEWVDLMGDSAPVPLPENEFSGDVLGWFGTNLLCHWNGTNRIVVSELHGAEFIQRGAVSLDPGTRPTGLAYDVPRRILAWSERAQPNSVYLASLAAPDRRIELKGDVPGLVPFRFSEDGNYLAARKRTGSLLVWRVETGQRVASIDGPIRDTTFAAGGKVLVVAMTKGNDHEILFYDLTLPYEAPRRVPGKLFCQSLAVSPDGGLVASATGGGLVRLFDPARGELIDSVHGHLNSAFGLAFSPDGRRLISTAGGREAVKVWDAGTRQELLTLGGNGSTLAAARWSADGDVILVGTPWQAWRAPSWEEIAAAEANGKAESKQP